MEMNRQACAEIVDSVEEMRGADRGQKINRVMGILNSLPVPMILNCPGCLMRHIDEGKFAVEVHHTHACQHCGLVWRPAIAPTVGVRFLPGFKNESD